MKPLLVFLLAVAGLAVSRAAEKPNVVLIYADDLGFGDLSCQGAAAGLTPNLDRLAKEGLNFTDAHATAATCTPSRYSLLTGQYAFRHPNVKILAGNAQMAIAPGTPTLPTMLGKAGYRSGVIGKWHLGLGGGEGIDWNGEIKPGPLEIGFHTAFILPATGDRVPCVYLRDHRIVNLDPADPLFVSYTGGDFDGGPLGAKQPELLKMKPSHGHDQSIVNGISRIGRMRGGKAALWVDEDMADTLTAEALAFVEANKAQPFFLYFALHDIHVPRVPHPRFVGKSGMGPRGDAIVQTDWCVGQVMEKLEALGLTKNTLVLFSSDNGPVIDDGYQDEAVEKLGAHKPAGPWRGGKYSAFEGGTRVPFLARWPGKIAPGVSEALISQMDLYASLAALTGQELTAGEASDSQNHLPALLGESKTARADLVAQANVLSLRQGQWKYIEPGKGPARNQNTNSETGTAPAGQLYDLSTDPGETKNLAAEHLNQVAQMATRLNEIRGPSR